ncbi:hypothetical protein ACF1G0_24360 [Streptomyces sp. NPDC013953]|uniref:hypothetical protein n=1 Tax=Streptomyces sp. NPDC013953 TaxID=3364868 RepID=UPI003702746C
MALLFLWGAWMVAVKGVAVLRGARRDMAASATAKGTCVGTGGTRHSYRFTTPDGATHVAYVGRTGSLDTPKVGSTALLRYRKDDPKVATTFATTVIVVPLGGVMTVVLALFCAVAGAVCGFLALALMAGL